MIVGNWLSSYTSERHWPGSVFYFSLKDAGLSRALASWVRGLGFTISLRGLKNEHVVLEQMLTYLESQ